MKLRLPYFWKGMSWTARAGWLCSSKQARDYSHACSILASMPRRKAAIVTAKVVPQTWYNRED